MAKLLSFSKPFRVWLIILGMIGLMVWLIFLDSQSLTTRITLENKRSELVTENNRLKAQIDSIETALETIESPEMIEKIAREQYGMRRPGETVYRVDPQ